MRTERIRRWETEWLHKRKRRSRNDRSITPAHAKHLRSMPNKKYNEKKKERPKDKCAFLRLFYYYLICFHLKCADDSATDDLLFGFGPGNNLMDGPFSSRRGPSYSAVDNLSDPLGGVTRLGNNAPSTQSCQPKQPKHGATEFKEERARYSFPLQLDALLRVSPNFFFVRTFSESGDFLTFSPAQSNIYRKHQGCAQENSHSPYINKNTLTSISSYRLRQMHPGLTFHMSPFLLLLMCCEL